MTMIQPTPVTAPGVDTGQNWGGRSPIFIVLCDLVTAPGWTQAKIEGGRSPIFLVLRELVTAPGAARDRAVTKIKRQPQPTDKQEESKVKLSKSNHYMEN